MALALEQCQMLIFLFLMKIYTVKPDFFTHNSDIIKTGQFKELLAPSAYEYYVKHRIALKYL